MVAIQLLEDLAEAFVRIILLIPPAYTILSCFLTWWISDAREEKFQYRYLHLIHR